MTEFFSQPDDSGPARASEAETSLFGRIGAQAADTLDPKDSLSGVYIARRLREGAAAGFAAHDWDGVGTPEQQMQLQGIEQSARDAIPDVSQSDAKLLLKQEGLSETDVHLGDAPTHKLPVLKMRIDEAHTRRDREAAISRGPQGFFPGALGFVTSLGVGMVDPVNAAAFAIPVIGEARMGKIIAGAGDSILARTAARAGQGAAQGAVGTAALQPADWWLHTSDGQDYTFAQAMESVIMGAGMGGAFHAAPGALRDWRARRQGLPLEGSPTDQVLRALNPIEARTEPPVGPEATLPREEEVPGIEPAATAPKTNAEIVRDLEAQSGISVVGAAEAADRLPPVHPAEVLADLPPAVREDAIHAAMADIISDRPVRSAELLNIAADHDPRIAESLDIQKPMLHLVRDDHLPGSGDTVSYSINGADGSNVGFAEFVIDGDTARILDIASFAFNGDRNRYNEVRNSIGARQMRELLEQFRELHPEVKKFTADRVSGARKGGEYDAGLKGNEIEVKLPGRGKRGRAAADPQTWSLFEHLASLGGLKPDPELRAIFGNDRGPFVPGFGPLLRKSGKTLDDAVIAAKEGGYFIDPTDPAHAPAHLADPAMEGREATFGIRDLLDKIDAESRGKRQYREGHLAATRHDPAHESHQVLAELEHELEASGAKVEDIDPHLLDRTVEIVKRDGETDVLAAYERAIMEDAERYDATAHERQAREPVAEIPGWDAADRGPASRDGEGGAGERGQAGRTDPGARGADGAQPPGAGRGNRSAPAVAAADPRWRELAETKPDYNEPEALAESEAAEHLPEPDSLVPEKSLSALERAAVDAEEVWRKLETTLTEDERATVNEVMEQLQNDRQTREQIITDGAACLMGAIG